MFVKPKTGRQVPDPDRGGYLPPEGREVDKSPYWLRRLKDQDVVLVADADVKPTTVAQPAGKDKGGDK